MTGRRLRLAAILMAALSLAACGKKGVPLAPKDEANVYPRSYPSDAAGPVNPNPRSFPSFDQSNTNIDPRSRSSE